MMKMRQKAVSKLKKSISPEDIQAVNKVSIKNLPFDFGFFELLAVGLLILFFSYNIYLFNKTLPNLSVGRHNLSFRNATQLSQDIDEIADRWEQFPLILNIGDRQIEVLPGELGISINREVTAEKLMGFGRSGNMINNTNSRISSLLKEEKIEADFSLDFERFNAKVNELLVGEDRLAKNAQVSLIGGRFVSVAEEPGNVVDYSLLVGAIRNSAQGLDSSEIVVKKVTESPKILSENTIGAVEKMSSLGVSNIELLFGFDRWTIGSLQLLAMVEFKPKGFEDSKLAHFNGFMTPISVEFISFEQNPAYDIDVALNPQRVDEFILPIANSIYKEAHDATLRFEDGKVIEFTPAQDGQELDIEKTRALILERVAINSIGDDKVISINLPVEVKAAEIANEEINNLGIKELVGRGISYFAGSIPNRVHNLTLGSSLISGTLVSPGEEFSFVKLVGPVSAQQGFKQAYIISKGRTVLDDGGGICQVSTTVYRAALNAGLPIVERTAHAYRVSYYEQRGFGPGLDATVFSPSVDLKFKNDTKKHILVQATVDPGNSRLQVDIYGTSDGRKTEVSKPVIISQSSAPEPLYQDDPSLPKGTVKQVDFAATGAKTYFTRKVSRGGEVIIDERVSSNFRPWQAVYLVGTGG